MPIFEKSGKRILFIHIPKVAGTSIEELFCSNGFVMSYRRGGRYGRLNDFDKSNRCSPQHMHAELLEKYFCNENFAWKFTFVRSPLSRIISEYNFRKSTSSCFQFDNFENWVYWTFEEYCRNQFIYDNHIRPQREFIWRDTQVFKLEDGMEQLMIECKKSFAEIFKVSNIRNYMASQKYINKNMISLSLKNIIRDFYAVDYEYFNYED